MMKMMHLLFSRLAIDTLHISCVFFGDVKLIDSAGLWQLFLLRAAGFLLPCYIMAWAISIMQRQRQRQVGGSVPMEMFLFHVYTVLTFDGKEFHETIYT
jgi:hypothetical protein